MKATISKVVLSALILACAACTSAPGPAVNTSYQYTDATGTAPTDPRNPDMTVAHGGGAR